MAIAGLQISNADTEKSDVFIEVEAHHAYPNSGFAGDSGQISSLLQHEPGVLVQSQGGGSAQNDLHIRGSSFSGAGLSLGGLALRNPQTEHFHLELPFSAMLFQRPTVVSGMDQVLSSSAHPVGSVTLNFAPIESGVWTKIGMDDEGGDRESTVVQERMFGSRNYAASFFVGRENLKTLDFDDNDLRGIRGGAHLQSRSNDHQTDLAFGIQRKEFGARGYYGVTPDWKAEEELEDRVLFAGHRRGNPEGEHIQIAALARSTEDRYKLFWTLPGVYENRHQSKIGAVTVSGKKNIGARSALNWRAGAEAENLESSNLGDHHRERGELMLVPEIKFGRVRFSGGGRGYVFSEESGDLAGMAGMEVDLPGRNIVGLSFTEAVRQPSFTELNYESPGSLGNSGLERERTSNLELGWKRRGIREERIQISTFARRSRHTVDWIKAENIPSARWTATDLGTVDAYGVEASGRGNLGKSASFGISGLWLHKSHEWEDAYAGRYVLDYPHYLIQLDGQWQAASWCRLSLAQRLRRQEDTESRAEHRFESMGQAAVALSLPKMPGWEITLSCENVWNEDYETFVGQPVAERRFHIALTGIWE